METLHLSAIQHAAIGDLTGKTDKDGDVCVDAEETVVLQTLNSQRSSLPTCP